MTILGGLVLLAFIGIWLVKTIATREVDWWAPVLAAGLVRLAARFTPKHVRGLWRARWLAELNALQEGRIPGVLFACGVVFAGFHIRVTAYAQSWRAGPRVVRGARALGVATFPMGLAEFSREVVRHQWPGAVVVLIATAAAAHEVMKLTRLLQRHHARVAAMRAVQVATDAFAAYSEADYITIITERDGSFRVVVGEVKTFGK